MDSLPPEILLQIFHQACLDEGLFDHRPSWRNYDLVTHDPNDPWPAPSLDAVKTAGALRGTCRRWRDLGLEFALRHLWLEGMENLRDCRDMVKRLDAGEREKIKRITLAMFKHDVWESVDHALVLELLDMTPKLEVFTNEVVTGGGTGYIEHSRAT